MDTPQKRYTSSNQNEVIVGLDIGSTTVKAVAIHPSTKSVLYRDYRRHRARQLEEARKLVEEIGASLPESALRFVVTGSGGAPIAEALDAPFVQEVVANAAAVQELCPQARTAIELGGQDAKVVFFAKNKQTGKPEVSDMRMNGSCAGGTGAFIDEMAQVLNVPVEDFNSLAERGSEVHPISGRCGVFAKTDIQPLAAAGVPRQDLALSVFHAIVKQTIGGLSQGHPIEAPVVFEGGPLMFNPTLIKVFAERLNLRPDEIVIPDNPETIVAYGAALMLADDLCESKGAMSASEAARILADVPQRDAASAPPLFSSKAERAEFEARHHRADTPLIPRPGNTRAYLGIDSGSTTTKMALISEDGSLLDASYSSSGGDPLMVAKKALSDLLARWREAGGQLEIVAAGATGYGEHLFSEAYRTDVHLVETVAHARAALKYRPDATFVLDIGGQDMKALWIDKGIVTDVVVNEACSSGCGSFLEGFASSLGVAREDMADVAFSSKAPAALGSRCTVFMNSSVITAQRAGKDASDIIAGLSRSIAENVFTKVIRTANIDRLGDAVVVQGGTFANDAVLRAFEQYLGKEVTRTPHPELAGAIGVALAAKEKADLEGGPNAYVSRFIGLEDAANLEFSRESGVVCELCANHCSRTIVRFSSGNAFVTGNRCLRGGEAVTKPETQRNDKEPILDDVLAKDERPQDLFSERTKLLFKSHPVRQVLPENNMTIGLPRVLSIWDNAPFWSGFFKSLGFKIRYSDFSNRSDYEDSLAVIPSDTACFPAKLAHSHIRNLEKQGVDRIFMPILSAVEPEGASVHSESMCALVKGYPMIIRSSESPEEHAGIPFDSPLFCWRTDVDRERQLAKFMQERFGIAQKYTREAIREGDSCQQKFKNALMDKGAEVIARSKDRGSFTVVLASRPYQGDPLVSHGLPSLFLDQGISVIPVDALPGLEQVRLDRSRLDIVNNYHARMLAGALYVAATDCLEYAQIVSFGCGHDAYLTDEIIRLMGESSHKTPLVLKVDESDAAGPLSIRVRSFVETVTAKRARIGIEDRGASSQTMVLPDPYPAKFRKEDCRQKTVLVPNTSHAFSRLMAAVFSKQGLRAVPLDVGSEEAIRLGKKYTHNDVCFPAQIVIGEALAALDSGKYDPDNTAIGMAKYIGDCRLTHYGALLRKALDDAGYEQVPIITNDGDDESDLHPGFRLSLGSALRIAFCLPMIDALEELLRKMRPYELRAGSSDAAFNAALDCIIEGVERHGAAGARHGFKKAIGIMKSVEYDRSQRRPRVLIVGEYLLNFHPGANRNIEGYLESHGMEIVEARMADVIRKTYFYQQAQVRELSAERAPSDRLVFAGADRIFEIAHNVVDGVAKEHPLYEPPCRLPELVKASDSIVPHTFDAGEGVLIPAEILHQYEHGVRSFVILQPFGCLPNHVVGRGIVKELHKRCPEARILTLDYDPDVSLANIENRLQMIVLSSREAA